MGPGWSLGGPGLVPGAWARRRITEGPEACAVFYVLIRVDPCIKCTRSKLSTAQVAAAFVDPTDLLYVCGTV